jgi:hypothetical protein
MEVSEDPRSDLQIKDIYVDIIHRFDATQRSQASIIQKICNLTEEIHDLKNVNVKEGFKIRFCQFHEGIITRVYKGQNPESCLLFFWS